MASLLAFSSLRSSSAQVVWPSGFESEVVASGLDLPTAFAVSPDGRIFVAEKKGRVRVVAADGSLLAASFVTLSVDTANDRGLVGIALHPDFPATPWVYLAYTTTTAPASPANSSSRIHRITRWTANGDVALPGSESIVVDDIASDSDSHTGGALRFGPDGFLYVSTGDGATYPVVDPLALRALDPDRLNGKILRVDASGNAPASNPFYTTAGANRSKVWQVGLRNPFKMAFRPASGALFVGDVGWRSWEELDSGPAGAGFGWPCYEGGQPQPLYQKAFPVECSGVSSLAPIWAYDHSSGNAATTGLAWYEGAAYPSEWSGRLFVSDYARRWIRCLTISPAGALQAEIGFATGDGSFHPDDLAISRDGELLWLNLAADFTVPSGSIGRVTFIGSGNHPPRPLVTASPSAGYAPLSVSFSAAGSTDEDGNKLTYSWDFGDGSQAAGVDVTHVFASSGRRVVRVLVSDPFSTREAQLTVTVGSLAPESFIATPGLGETWVSGDRISFSGNATDPDDGPLPPEALRWTVILHHDEHEHAWKEGIGAGGSFVAVDPDGAAGDAWFEVVLTSTDSTGLSDTKRVPVLKNRPPVAVAIGPAGVACSLPAGEVVLDGSGSFDLDLQPLSFAWTQTAGTAVVLSGARGPVASFFPPTISGGTVLGFELSVADGHESGGATVGVVVSDLTDLDGDGSAACGDCDPDDASNPIPAEVANLRVGSGPAPITWSSAPFAATYELLRGDLSVGFTQPPVSIASGLTTTSSVDPSPVGAGGFWYVVRAENACGVGPLAPGAEAQMP